MVWYKKCIHQEVHGRSIFLFVSTIKVDRGQSLTKHKQFNTVKWSNYMLSRRDYFRWKDTNRWKRKMWIGELTQCVKNLPSKHENPSFYPQNYVKLETAACVYNSSTLKADGWWRKNPWELRAMQPDVPSRKENQTKPRVPFSKMEDENH